MVGATTAGAAQRLWNDAFVLVAVGLTLAALLSILTLVAVDAGPFGIKLGDRVLQFDQAGAFGQFGYGLLALAALALTSIDPVDAGLRKVVAGLRALVGVVAAAVIVVCGYGVIAFSTDAAIGHTQFMSDWGPAARTATTGSALSSVLLGVCALWLVTQRATDAGDETETAQRSVTVPSWSVVAPTALLVLMGAIALVEVVGEPVFRSSSPLLGETHAAVIDRIDTASRAFGSYPIALLTFVAVCLVVAARRRVEPSGAPLLAVASTVAVLGVAVAVFVVVRVVARHGAGQTGWTRTEVITSALASGIVAALAWIVALRFATTDRRAESITRSSPFRAPALSTIRVASTLVGAATIGHAMNIGAIYAIKTDPLPFGAKAEGSTQLVMLAAGVALGAALLAELARRADTRWTGRAFLAVVAGVALFLGAYGAEQALIAHPQLAASSLQSHAFVAFGVVAVVLALATLSLIMNGLRDEPDADEEIRAIGSAAP